MTAEKGGNIKVLEYQRTQQGVEVERFLWLHAGCDVQLKIKTLNSSEVDPSTGDPKPMIKEFFECSPHHVQSASRDILGV